MKKFIVTRKRVVWETSQVSVSDEEHAGASEKGEVQKLVLDRADAADCWQEGWGEMISLSVEEGQP